MLFKEKLARLCQWLKKKSYVLCCGIAPIVILTALIVIFDFGCNVIVDGEVIGSAPSKKYVTELKNSINAELSPYLGGADAVAVDIVTTPKLAIRGTFDDRQLLGEKLKSYCPYMEKAYTVKSNGRTVAAFTTEKDRKDSYKRFLKEASDSCSDYKVLDEISFEYELVPYGLIKSGDGAYKMLMRAYDFEETIGIDKESSIKEILCDYAITKKEFMSLNPKYKEGKTQSVRVKSKVPYIRVLTTNTCVESTPIRYTVKYEMDDTLKQGTRDIKLSGKNGFDRVTKTAYNINGKKLCNITTEKSHKDSVNEVILIGTKPLGRGESTGTITAPCASGLLTSRYGSREGRVHKGIDICGDEGSNIQAADGGTIVFAGWDDSGYGNVVKIEHSSGYTTLYAHCRDLYVKKGDKVKQGDIIASLGNTGRSTGPHIHFEVIVTETSVSVDPLKFFDASKFNFK